MKNNSKPVLHFRQTAWVKKFSFADHRSIHSSSEVEIEIESDTTTLFQQWSNITLHFCYCKLKVNSLKFEIFRWFKSSKAILTGLNSDLFYFNKLAKYQT